MVHLNLLSYLVNTTRYKLYIGSEAGPLEAVFFLGIKISATEVAPRAGSGHICRPFLVSFSF